jgi:hypothetical protein
VIVVPVESKRREMFAKVASNSIRNASRRSMGTYKTSTGLVGLAVDPNGRENLISVADQILDSVAVSACFGAFKSNSVGPMVPADPPYFVFNLQTTLDRGSLPSFQQILTCLPFYSSQRQNFLSTTACAGGEPVQSKCREVVHLHEEGGE